MVWKPKSILQAQNNLRKITTRVQDNQASGRKFKVKIFVAEISMGNENVCESYSCVQ